MSQEDYFQSMIKKYIETHPEEYKKAQETGNELMNNPIFEKPMKGKDYEGDKIRREQLQKLLDDNILEFKDLTSEEKELIKSN